MRLVRLTRLQRARLRLQVQLRLPPMGKSRLRLLRVLRQHRHQLAHPVRLRSRLRARRPVRALNRPLVLSQPLALSPLRHRPVSSMNLKTMKSDLVGRGSRRTEDCFRSLQRFEIPNSAGPINPPSRWSKMWQLSARDSNLEMVLQFSPRWARLGNPVGLIHHEAGLNDEPCDYQLAFREPRPTKVPVTNHLSLLTSHLSHQGYVCS